MCFMLYERQLFIFPVKVLETQVFDISNPKTKNTCKKDHCIVTFSDRAVPINDRKHCFQFIKFPCRRYFGTFGNSRHMDLFSIISGEYPDRINKTQKMSDPANILFYGLKTIPCQRFQIRIANSHSDIFCSSNLPLLKIVHKSPGNPFIMSDCTC